MKPRSSALWTALLALVAAPVAAAEGEQPAYTLSPDEHEKGEWYLLCGKLEKLGRLRAHATQPILPISPQ